MKPAKPRGFARSAIFQNKRPIFRNVRKMRRYNFWRLAYNRIFCKFQQQLFSTGIPELNGSFGILATAFHSNDGADTKALVLDDVSFAQPNVANRGLRSWCLPTEGHQTRLGVSNELRSHRSGILHSGGNGRAGKP